MNESKELFKKLTLPHHKYLAHATIVKGVVKEVTQDSKVK